MKKIIFFICMLFSVNCFAYDVAITFQWDSDEGENWKQINFYVRRNEEPYNFDIPSETLLQEYENGKSIPVELFRAWEFPDNQKTKLSWVARAVDNDGKLSDPSNEVTLTLDLTSLKTSSLEAEYSKTENSITFKWSVIDPRIMRYRIYSSEAIEGPFEKQIAKLENDDILDKELEININELFPDGKLTTQYFILKGFSDYGLKSEGSNVVKIEIDRRIIPVDKVLNFKLKLIPSSEGD